MPERGSLQTVEEYKFVLHDAFGLQRVNYFHQKYPKLNRVEIERILLEVRKEILAGKKVKKGERGKTLLSYDDAFNHYERRVHRKINNRISTLIELKQKLLSNKEFVIWQERFPTLPPEQIQAVIQNQAIRLETENNLIVDEKILIQMFIERELVNILYLQKSEDRAQLQQKDHGQLDVVSDQKLRQNIRTLLSLYIEELRKNKTIPIASGAFLLLNGFCGVVANTAPLIHDENMKIPWDVSNVALLLLVIRSLLLIHGRVKENTTHHINIKQSSISHTQEE